MITRISNIQVYNTSRRIFEKLDVYIKDEYFYHIGNDDIPYDVLVDGHDHYMIPGLIDSHMHIESSMTTPQEYSNTVLPLGTTTILADAHEVANVFGVQGLLEYMNQEQTLDVYWAIPSSVPSTNSTLETTGGTIDDHAVVELAKHPRVIALGEIMNFKDVTSDEDTLTKRIIKSFRSALPLAPVEGHIPRVSGLELSKFIELGIGSDHTHQSVDSLIEKTRAGILVQLQEKSLTPEIIQAIYDYELLHSIALVTDDVLPNDLMDTGSLNHIIKKVVSMGMDIKDAIFASTYTPAQRLRLFDRGIIAPGKIADAVILSSLDDFVIEEVYKKGRNINDIEKDTIVNFNESSYHSIQRNPVSIDDFIVKSEGDSVKVRVMERESGATFTHEEFVDVAVKDGIVQWEEAGLSLISVIERYGHNVPITWGFVKNGFTTKAAIASSWAHDHHNILVMGTDVHEIVATVNRVIEMQGGIVWHGESVVEVPLPYGGVVSLEPMPQLAQKIKTISEEMRTAGYESINSIMSFSVLGLLVSPYLKISEHGYVDVRTQTFKSWNAS